MNPPDSIAVPPVCLDGRVTLRPLVRMPEAYYAEWERLYARVKRARKGSARFAAERALAAHELGFGEAPQ